METPEDLPGIPANIDGYRRPGSADAGTTGGDPGRGAPTSYERDVRAALARMTENALARIREADAPLPLSEIRLSVSRVVKAAGCGRTWIHIRHRHLVAEIEAAQAEVLRAQMRRDWSRAKSKKELLRTISQLRAELERQAATVASQQLSALRTSVAPSARERDALLAENADLKAKLAEAEETRSTQTAMIRMLVQANNTRRD